MRVVIAYESVYGNTRAVADAIANGFPPYDDVTVKTVHELCPDDLVADVLVVGAPTHAHGLPRRASRRAARDLSSTTRPDQRLEPTAQQPGVREWLEQLPPRIDLRVAAFDTRFGLPAWTSGHPARRISRTLRRRGAHVLTEPASFIVEKQERLRAGELDRACRWGEELADLARGAPIEPSTGELDVSRLRYERDRLEPLISVPSVNGAPIALPDTAPHEPEPGLAAEQENSAHRW